jgi:hypothetical protein
MAIPSPTGLIDNQSKRKRKRRAGRGKSGVPETTGWRKRAAARWMEEAETAAAAMGRGKRRRAIDPDGGGGIWEDDSTGESLYPACAPVWICPVCQYVYFERFFFLQYSNCSNRVRIGFS